MSTKSNERPLPIGDGRDIIRFAAGILQGATAAIRKKTRKLHRCSRFHTWSLLQDWRCLLENGNRGGRICHTKRCGRTTVFCVRIGHSRVAMRPLAWAAPRTIGRGVELADWPPTGQQSLRGAGFVIRQITKSVSRPRIRSIRSCENSTAGERSGSRSVGLIPQ